MRCRALLPLVPEELRKTCDPYCKFFSSCLHGNSTLSAQEFSSSYFDDPMYDPLSDPLSEPFDWENDACRA